MKPLSKNGDKYIKIENSEGKVAFLNLKILLKKISIFSSISLSSIRNSC